MKKYIAPEMITMVYAANETIAAQLDTGKSREFNDGELEW